MRRLLVALVAFAGALILAIPNAWAGSPHFIARSLSATVSGNTLTVSGREAGLGDESQVHIVVTATASCINHGGKHPGAANKTSVSATGDFPVQNGKADFSLSVTATFQPDCSPPMTVAWSHVVVADTTNGISARVL
jgi:hypothetical protein